MCNVWLFCRPNVCCSAEPQPQPQRQHQPGEEEPRLRGLREGLQGRLPPQPPPAVPLGREALLLPRLPAALQEEGQDELPRALAPGRRGETVHLSSLRQGLLAVRTDAHANTPHGQMGGDGPEGNTRVPRCL